jgi:hypothetical protein
MFLEGEEEDLAIETKEEVQIKEFRNLNLKNNI